MMMSSHRRTGGYDIYADLGAVYMQTQQNYFTKYMEVCIMHVATEHSQQQWATV